MSNLVILKSKKNNKQSFSYRYETTDLIQEYIDQLTEYKKMLDCCKIYYPAEKLYRWCNHKNLRRIFCNGSFEEGGRYYAGYQAMSMSEESRRPEHILNNLYRKDITIYNDPILEIDYESIHPNLIYHMQQNQLVGKAYANIDAPKKWIKLWLLIALNAKDLKTALYAFRKQYIEEISNLTYKEIKSNNRKKFNELDFEAYNMAKLIHNQLKIKQPLITKYLYTGIGTTLQFHDSEIMRNIMWNCMQYKIPMLPVHDSCIIRKQDEHNIKTIMTGVYTQYVQNTFGMENANINVEIKC